MLNLLDLNTVDVSWRKASIPKKTPGQFRELTIPNDNLMRVQKDVLDYLYALINARKIKVSACAHGFIPNRGCMTSILQHDRNAKCMVSYDMTDFFTNCRPIFAEAKLLDAGVAEPYVKGIHRCCTFENTLPQGAPTSPMLTNIAMFDVDNMIASYAEDHGFRYTRYADDLVFTLEKIDQDTERMLRKSKETGSKNPFVWFGMGVETILKNSMGLTLNHKKDNIVFRDSPHKSFRALGIVIRQDGKGYNASNHFRKNTRAGICALYHKIFDDQGGKIEDDDYKKWAELKGSIRYMNACRRPSDEGYDGDDPVIQERYYKPLEAHFDAAREIRCAARART